jgi:hypothetical protein
MSNGAYPLRFPPPLPRLQATNTVVDEYRVYVKPVVHPKLSAFCTELTGITQAQVDAAEPMDAVRRLPAPLPPAPCPAAPCPLPCRPLSCRPLPAAAPPPSPRGLSLRSCQRESLAPFMCPCSSAPRCVPLMALGTRRGVVTCDGWGTRASLAQTRPPSSTSPVVGGCGTMLPAPLAGRFCVC